MWEAKATELGDGIDVAYLISWYKSMWTRYGKLSKRPSGSGTEEPTERELWIMHKFGFLKNFISRQKGRQLGGLAEKVADVRLISGEESTEEEGTKEVAVSLGSTSEPISQEIHGNHTA